MLLYATCLDVLPLSDAVRVLHVCVQVLLSCARIYGLLFPPKLPETLVNTPTLAALSAGSAINCIAQQMGAEASKPVVFRAGCFREQLRYVEHPHDWRLRPFDFPLLHIRVSVQAGRESKCSFRFDGQEVDYPDLMFHPLLGGLSELNDQARIRKALPLDNALSFEVSDVCRGQDPCLTFCVRMLPSWTGRLMSWQRFLPPEGH